MDIVCIECSSEFELEGTSEKTTMPCPVCGVELSLEQNTKAPATPKKRARMQVGKQPTKVGKRRKKNKPAKTGLVTNWLWLYAVAFMIGAVVAGYIFSNIVHQQTGKVSGLVVGVPVGLFLGLFGVAFGVVARGLQNKKQWAYRMGCNFLYINIFSPFFILSFMGLNKMAHDDTLKAFGIDAEEEI